MTATCAFPGCDTPIRQSCGAKWCLDHARMSEKRQKQARQAGVRGGSAAQSARRTRALERLAESPAPETRQQPPQPTWRLPPRNPAVVIRPPRPAPLRVYRGTGRPCEFQDDLNAIADHGSPEFGGIARWAA